MAMNEADLNLAIIARTGGKGQQSLADGNWKAVAVSPLTSNTYPGLLLNIFDFKEIICTRQMCCECQSKGMAR
jgi:hypothetical protein